MGYKNDDKCIKNALDNESLFVLMARDEQAPLCVLEWIKQSFYSQPEEKLREAFDRAMAMRFEKDLVRLELSKICTSCRVGLHLNCGENECACSCNK